MLPRWAQQQAECHVDDRLCSAPLLPRDRQKSHLCCNGAVSSERSASASGMPCARACSSQRRASQGCARPQRRRRDNGRASTGHGRGPLGGGAEPSLARSPGRRAYFSRRHAWRRARTSRRYGLWRPPARIARRGCRVGGPAAAVHHHFRKRNLRVHYAGVGCAREPSPRAWQVGDHAAPLRQHASVHVLCFRDPVGGAPQPASRLLLVSLKTDPFDQAYAEIECRDQVASEGSLLEPPCNPVRILRSARALRVRDWPSPPARPDRRPRQRHAAIARPPRCLAPRRRRSGTMNQARGGGFISRLGSSAVPVRRLGIIRGQWTALNIEIADQCCRLRIAGQRCTAKPRFTRRRGLARHGVPPSARGPSRTCAERCPFSAALPIMLRRRAWDLAASQPRAPSAPPAR